MRQHSRFGIAFAPLLSLAFLFVATALPAARESVDDALTGLLERMGGGPSAIGGALSLYNRIEAAQTFDEFGRFRIHEELVTALKKVDDPGVLSHLRTFLNSSKQSYLPAKVVIMKAMLGRAFPLPRAERIEEFLDLARGNDFRIFIWAVRLLGDSGWPEGVEALIALLEGYQAAKSTDDTVRGGIIGAELYRIMGNQAPQGAAAGAIRRSWEKLGRMLPKKVDFSPDAGSGRTISFFGDLISPRSVFVIDHSTSMREETSLVGLAHGTTVEGESGKDEKREPKVVIVKRELENSIKSLQSHYKFNILGYNAKVYPWRPLKLHPATASAKASAGTFAAELEVNRGTNIHDSLKTALPIPELDTVYLLSDGVPSVGGNQAAIEKRVKATNYLLGVRIVTYGFAAEKQGSYDEDFMRRLAADNWGWYRRLNR